MKIAAYNGCSFVDYPGKIVAVIFTKGCNMQCPYCHNKDLLNIDAINEAAVLEHLNKRKNQLDGVVISGGEPTLHRDLPLLLKRIKTMGYKVKLDTNGTNPDMLRTIIDYGLVDYIAMDIKTVERKYQKLTGISFDAVRKSVEIIKGFGDYEFRTTAYPEIRLEELEHLCQVHRDEHYFLQQYRVTQDGDPQPYSELILSEIAKRYGVSTRGL